MMKNHIHIFCLFMCVILMYCFSGCSRKANSQPESNLLSEITKQPESTQLSEITKQAENTQQPITTKQPDAAENQLPANEEFNPESDAGQIAITITPKPITPALATPKPTTQEPPKNDIPEVSASNTYYVLNVTIPKKRGSDNAAQSNRTNQEQSIVLILDQDLTVVKKFDNSKTRDRFFQVKKDTPFELGQMIL